MLYVNGEAEDERDHAAFCRSVDAGLAFPGWKAERCVRCRGVGVCWGVCSCSVSLVSHASRALSHTHRVVWGREGKERVVEVRPGDGPAQLHKMAEVKRIVDQDMGFVPLAEGKLVPGRGAVLCCAVLCCAMLGWC